jgi:nucleotide-binding universal stress UspA family protein
MPESAPVQRYRRLAVGLTRTATDPGLLRYAAMVARLGTAAEVRFVHVLPADPAPDPAAVREELRAAVRDHFTDVPDTVTTAFDVLPGPLFDRLLAYTAEQPIDLLLLGHRRDHPGRWALARRLGMTAPASVWMVPEGSPAALDRILVPVDFSDHTADSLRVAASMAALAGHAECLALHVYFNEATVTYEGYDAILRGREAEAFEQFVAPIDTQGVRVTPVFEEGANVAHVVNRVAERDGCDLVVMASRGRSRSAAILLGSVAEETIRETRVPLLVVKHYGARMGFLEALFEKGILQKSPKFD